MIFRFEQRKLRLKLMVAHTMKGSRGTTKAYGKMLILAFGLAVIAVMVVHKLRERRILNLIVDEKDQQLNSLQLLLQREVDFNKEMSRKIEDLKPRLHMLRSQKMELNGRVVELQSTVASLKDEIRVVESALEVKKKENKMLRDKITEILKEKDAEIQLLKQLLNTTTTAGVYIQTQIDKVGEVVDLKKVDDSRGEDAEEKKKQNDGQVGDVSRAGMKLEVAYKSKHGALSSTKGRNSRAIGGNKGLKHSAATTSRKVSKGEQVNAQVEDDNRFNVKMMESVKTDDEEISKVRKHEIEVVLKDGELKTENSTQVSVSQQQDHEPINQRAQENLTLKKLEETNKSDDKVSESDSGGSHESMVVEVHRELNGNTETREASQKIEIKDVSEQLISGSDNAYSSQESRTDSASGHSDLILHKEKEHALQDSETENGGSNTEESDNGSSDSETEQDQHDPISHSENDEEDHTNAEEEHDASHEANSVHTAVEEEKEEYNA